MNVCSAENKLPLPALEKPRGRMRKTPDCRRGATEKRGYEIGQINVLIRKQ